MVNKAYLKADYEATKHLVGLTMRQKELLEAWLYTCLLYTSDAADDQ